MDWHKQREEWNKNLECAREACRAKLDEKKKFVHLDSRLHYCERCADLINTYNPGLVREE